jgi:hypothetical protein
VSLNDPLDRFGVPQNLSGECGEDKIKNYKLTETKTKNIKNVYFLEMSYFQFCSI